MTGAKNFVRGSLGFAVVLAAFVSAEANAQQNMNVSATVPEVCVISNENTDLDMAFDLSSLASATTDFAVDVNFLWRCSQDNAATINISSGGGDGANGTTRFMTGPGDALLAYSLTKPDNSAWGDGSNGQPGLGVTGQGMANADVQTTVVTGTVTLSDAQDAPVGAYSDTVQISLLP